MKNKRKGKSIDMRMETLILFVSLGLCFITPIMCRLIKGEVQKRKICYFLFSLITAFLLIDVLLMIHYQLQSNFMFQYVYNHTSIDLEKIYKVSALWAGQEGSFLLWSFIMSAIGLFVIGIKEDYDKKVISVYSILCGSIVILTVKSNPFKLTDMLASDGMGLSEALKNPWMVVHPPLVFIGYSGMAVLFSLFIVINMKIKVRDNSVLMIKQWTLVSFLFLSLGIFTGSIWAYGALGWGGYWSWDPIENAALVSWLILCAYLHGKKSFSKLDCIIPFTLAVFGTFLTRSGILKERSVHAYTVGKNSFLTFLLLGIFVLLIIVISVLNFIIQKKQNNTPLSCFRLATYSYAAFILIGTICPLITKKTVSVCYYNILSLAYVIINILLLLNKYTKVLLKRFLPICILNTILILVIVFSYDIVSIWLLFLWITFLSAWVLCFSINLKNLPFTISHFAIILLFAGAIASTSLSKKYDSIQEVSNSNIMIDNKSVSINNLKNKESVILSSIKQDIILNYSQVTVMDENTVYLSYTTKPLIVLFWMGGWLFILSVAISFLPIRKDYLSLRSATIKV